MASDKQRVQIDITEMVDEIDRYPEGAGIDGELWREMTYPQKLRYLLKKQLETAQQKLDQVKDS